MGSSMPHGDDVGNDRIHRVIQPPTSSSSVHSVTHHQQHRQQQPFPVASGGSALLRPLSTEDAMAGVPLPPRGFCLRLVTGDRHTNIPAYLHTYLQNLT
jgi:hypothetical protein